MGAIGAVERRAAAARTAAKQFQAYRSGSEECGSNEVMAGEVRDGENLVGIVDRPATVEPVLARSGAIAPIVDQRIKTDLHVIAQMLPGADFGLIAASDVR